MTDAEIKAIVRLRRVTEDTVKRWVREGGDVYARTHIPSSRTARGRKARLKSPDMSFLGLGRERPRIVVTEEQGKFHEMRSKVDDYLTERQVERELREVWE